MPYPWLSRLCAGLILILWGLNASMAAEPSDRPPNFIVVFCDNLGYGDIEPFGATLHRTPNLARMAEEGRKFTHFNVTAGVCTPSRASIMTGCYPQRVGLHTNPRDGLVLRPVSPYQPVAKVVHGHFCLDRALFIFHTLRLPSKEMFTCRWAAVPAGSREPFG